MARIRWKMSNPQRGGSCSENSLRLYRACLKQQSSCSLFLARATLEALKSRLALRASVLRGGAWKIIPAAKLVDGDVVKLTLGGVVAADVTGAASLHRLGTGLYMACDAAKPDRDHPPPDDRRPDY